MALFSILIYINIQYIKYLKSSVNEKIVCHKLGKYKTNDSYIHRQSFIDLSHILFQLVKTVALSRLAIK